MRNAATDRAETVTTPASPGSLSQSALLAGIVLVSAGSTAHGQTVVRVTEGACFQRSASGGSHNYSPDTEPMAIDETEAILADQETMALLGEADEDLREGRAIADKDLRAPGG